MVGMARIMQPQEIHALSGWTDAPILFVSFSGDDHIHELQRWFDKNGNGQVGFFAHTLLGVDWFLEEVEAYMS